MAKKEEREGNSATPVMMNTKQNGLMQSMKKPVITITLTVISLQRLREMGKCKESDVWKERGVSLICGFQRHDVNHVGPDDDHYQ